METTSSFMKHHGGSLFFSNMFPKKHPSLQPIALENTFYITHDIKNNDSLTSSHKDV